MFNYTKIANFLSNGYNFQGLITYFLPSAFQHMACELFTNPKIYTSLYMNLFQVQYNNQQLFKDFYWVGKKRKTPSS
jgi:hypothetical protein